MRYHPVLPVQHTGPGSAALVNKDSLLSEIQDEIVTVLLLLLQPSSADQPAEGASVKKAPPRESQLQHLWKMPHTLSKIFESDFFFFNLRHC